MLDETLARSSRFVAACLLGLFLLSPGLLASSGAARASDDAAAFVQRLGAEATATLANRQLSAVERHDSLRTLLLSRFDVGMISRIVLGRHWQAATDQEKADFNALFGDFVVATYGRHLDNYAGETLQVGRAVDKGKRGTLVKSHIVRPGGNPVSLNWRLRRVGEDWRVVDLIVEGVSLALTHRAEADSVIRNGNGRIAALLERMRSLIAKSSGETVQPAAGAS